MKLVSGAALLAATASAQNIQELVTEFVNKIYSVDDSGKVHSFNIEPYFVADYECLGEGEKGGFKSGGYYGNGNGKILYSEQASWDASSFNYKLDTSGRVSSAPLALVFPFPEDVSTDAFDETLEFSASMGGVKAKMVGTIGSGSYDGAFSLNLGTVQTTAKKFSIAASLDRKMVHNNVNSFWVGWLPPHGETNVQLKANMRKECMENPIDKSCTAKVSVDGSHNGAGLGNTVAKYSVQKKRVSLIVSQDDAEIASVSILGTDTMEVLGLKYKLAGQPGVLVVQAVGPAGIQAVIDAARKFSAPFENFFNKIDFTTHHHAAHIIAYFDKVMKNVVGKNFFNAYPVIEATHFESDLLAKAMNAASVQSAAKEYSETLNSLIEKAANENHKYVAEARAFVKQVVSSEGEKTFDTWFSTL